jgi:hypothetical protein
MDDPKLRRQLVLLNTRVGATTLHHSTSLLYVHLLYVHIKDLPGAAPDANVHSSGENTLPYPICGLMWTGGLLKLNRRA